MGAGKPTGICFGFRKGGFAPPVAPIGGMVLEPEQLGQVFGATASPVVALALEAPSDAHFHVLFNHSAAAAYRSESASDGATK